MENEHQGYIFTREAQRQKKEAKRQKARKDRLAKLKTAIVFVAIIGLIASIGYWFGGRIGGLIGLSCGVSLIVAYLITFGLF